VEKHFDGNHPPYKFLVTNLATPKRPPCVFPDQHPSYFSGKTTHKNPQNRLPKKNKFWLQKGYTQK
jgi:hypothetical protein